ncbi:MAG TPA: hypothetical protein VJS44_14495 [Pyrinomonadaceae bacterium]|nr:hypothetical protein [Pyrinomonadaceae bacterium]
MLHLKARLLGLVIIAIFAGLLYYDWHMLRQEGQYYMKLAVLAPLGIIGGIFVLLFPTKAGPPQTGSDKLVVFLVFLLGAAAGALNLYLMDPGFFSFR